MRHPVVAAFEWGWDTFVAIGTLGLAVFTAALARQTRALAVASTEDEQAQWRPVLITGDDTVVSPYTDDEGRQHLYVDVRNVGRGPAFAVQAQLRSEALGATPPGSVRILVPGEEMELELRVSEESTRKLTEQRRRFPPAHVEISISYYDVGERWHETHFTAVRSDEDRLVVRKVLVNQTDRLLRPVHGSRRAKAAEARRENRPWRRIGRAVAVLVKGSGSAGG